VQAVPIRYCGPAKSAPRQQERCSHRLAAAKTGIDILKLFLYNSVGRLDLVAWILVLAFFGASALLFGGNIGLALLGATGIILIMALISASIEIIIESLKNTKGIGTLTGFITNGPEAVCLLVGLLAGDIIFAASTPLGSNFMNPLLLFAAALLCRCLATTLATQPLYTLLTISLTATLAAGFFFLPPDRYHFWLLASVPLSTVLFFFRPEEHHPGEAQPHSFPPARWLPPAAILLTAAGYCLDPVVSFTANHSHAPKGVIGFVVLATLTSWPEFKSCLTLLAKGLPLAAILNITVSNITNIWLAGVGVAGYLLSR
jgi:cation:H+ antiporter